MNIKYRKGFTIMELVLIIAIIGMLILLPSLNIKSFVKDSKLVEINSNIMLAKNVVGRELILQGNLNKWGNPFKIKFSNSIANGELYNENGLVNSNIAEGVYWEINKKDIPSELKGTFYANKNEIYYLIEESYIEKIEVPIEGDNNNSN